jgi:hypothetical protein
MVGRAEQRRLLSKFSAEPEVLAFWPLASGKGGCHAVLAAFLCCDKVTERNQLKGGEVWDHSVHRSGPWSGGWGCCFRAVVAQCKGTGGRNLFTYGSQEAKRETGKDSGPNIPFKGMPPVTSLPPTRPLIVKVPPPPVTSTVAWGPNLQHLGFGAISD